MTPLAQKLNLRRHKPKNLNKMAYRFNGDDFYNEFNSLIETWTWPMARVTHYKSYNPEEYDLVPKKGIIEKRIKDKEEEIRRVEGQKKLEMEGWDNRIKNLQNDIEELKKKL
jgi:hypothetical protein